MIGLIWAESLNKVIGRDGEIPWHLPEDLARFKEITAGHTVVMGRKTWDSLPRKPLPYRRNIVVTRNFEWSADGAEVAHSLGEALELAGDEGEVWVIGGESLLQEAMPRADRIELTTVDISVPIDGASSFAFAPFDLADWDVDEWGTWRTSEHGPRFISTSLIRP